MIQGLLFFIKFSWKNKKSYLALNIINQVLIGFLPIVGIAMPKYIIDELLGYQRWNHLTVYLMVLLVALFLNNWLITHISLQIFNQRCYLVAHFDKFMHEKLVNTDFCNLESPNFFDMKEKANKFLYGEGHGFAYVLESAFSIIGKLFTLFSIIVIVMTMNIGLVLFFIFIILLSAIVDSRVKEKSHKLTLEAVMTERRWGYFGRVLEDVEYSKEIRMNNIGGWLIDREMAFSLKAIEFYKKRNHYFSIASLFNSFSLLIQNGITYVYLIYSILVEKMTFGQFTMYINAVSVFSNSVKDVISNIIDIRVYGIYYEAFNQYITIPETLRENKHLPLPEIDDFTISFQNVSFKYPGQNKYVLKGLNIDINSKTKLAVVGENGAGKTTFIKLLCRLYDPTEGEILINGINIKDIDYDQYMTLFSAVFQDFKLFAFSVKENILFKNGTVSNNEIANELLRKVNMEKKISSLPYGLNTNIYKEFDENGFEPSGGEGQKIAIARALAKESKIVILDEPLSALDPKAEYEIFQKFNELINQKTAIYISHRLSSCQLCDAIIVFSEGSIIEYGSHEKLMSQGGKYAELYNLQAQYYQK